MRVLSQLLLATLLLTLNTTLLAAEKLFVENAWIPEMPPVSRVHAGFAKFHNNSDKAIEIVAISSQDYGKIEMHLSKEADGMARMIPQKSLYVQAKSSLELKHGSYHLMMFEPKRRLKAGDTIELTMTFTDGSNQTYSASVRSSLTPSGHDHMHHDHHHEHHNH